MNTLLNAIEEYERQASTNTDLESERSRSLDYYLGIKPAKPSIPDRSGIVSRDVSDSVEWTKPSLCRVFTSGDEVVVFNPVNQDDIQAAEQETDYINYIITQKNDWFSLFYQWCDDALLQKNGYIKAYWDESEDLTKETYKQITDDQLALVMQDTSAEILELNSYPNPYAPPSNVLPMAGAVNAAMAQPMQPSMLHDVVVQKKRTYGCVKLCGLPPERTRVYALHKEVSLENCEFFEHWEEKTISDLRLQGFDVPDDIADEATSMEDSINEQLSRNRYNENIDAASETVDPSMRKVRVRECWVKFDEDGDGKAELLHVIVVGVTMLLKEEADLVPVACITPRMWPHRHIGMSLTEFAFDIQDVKTQLQRGFVDNMYFAINGRHGVDKDRVNLDDMLTSRPAGIVRTEGPPSTSIMPLVHEANFGPVLQGLQYFDTVREDRTGASKGSGQLSPDILSKLPSGVAISQILSNSQALTELIARVFAETGVKSLFRIVHALTLKNARQEEVVRLRNKWVTVDPRQWRHRADMTISVGLGTGSKEQQGAFLKEILGLQLNPLLIQQGITDKKTVHHALAKLTQSNGFKDSTAFWNDPETAQPLPQQSGPPPDPIKMAELQLKSKLEPAKLQIDYFDAQTKRMQAQASAQLDAAKVAQSAKQVEHGVNMDRANFAVAQQAGSDTAETKKESSQMMQALQNMMEAQMQAEQKAEQRHEQLLQALLHIARPKSKVIVRDPKTQRIVRADEVPTETLQCL